MSTESRAVVTIHLDGRPMVVTAGMTVAAALANSGELGLRTSVSGERRGVLCSMGLCHECRLTVDGVAHRRGCATIVADGMQVERDA